MPWTGHVESKEFVSSTAATTNTFTSFGANIPVGSLIIVGFAINAATTAVNTMTDNSSQSGNVNVYQKLPLVGNTNVCGNIWYCYTTRQIQTTDTVTQTVDSTSRRNARLLTFTGSHPNPFDIRWDEPVVTTSPIVNGPLGPITDCESLLISASFWAGGAVTSGIADSTSGYTLVASTGSGGVTSRVECNISYRKDAYLPTETDTHSFTSITRALGQMAAFRIARNQDIRLVDMKGVRF